MSKTSMLSASAFAVLLSAGAACAQTTTTTTSTWSRDDGTALTQTYKTQNYTVVNQPDLRPEVGVALPGTITYYPLPSTINIPNREQYEYSVINNEPVVVEKTTRRVVHTWAP
jgi:hypothetical protein